MSDAFLVAPVELTDAELDAVTGGAPSKGGLVNVVDIRDVKVALPVTRPSR